MPEGPVKRDRKAPEGASPLEGNGRVELLSVRSAGIPPLERISAESDEKIPAHGSDVEGWAVGETEARVHGARLIFERQSCRQAFEIDLQLKVGNKCGNFREYRRQRQSAVYRS